MHGTFNFIVDTGSAASFLSWEDAKKMGIDIDELPVHPKGVAGFGGTAEARHLKETCYVYLTTEEGTLTTVELPEGMVLSRPPRKKKTHWVPGSGVTILGRDFLEKSGLTLRINLRKNELFLESE